MGAYLGRDALLRPRELRTEEVHVPELADPETGADVVLVQEMRGRERDEWEASLTVTRGSQRHNDLRNLRAKLVARCVVDPDTREPILTRDDVAALGEQSAAALNRIFEAASRLSGLSEEDTEETAGNSAAAPSGGSTSA